MINVEKAFRQTIKDKCFFPDNNLALPNRNFTPPVGELWAEFFFVPNDPTIAALGACGSDEVTGFMQLQLNVPTGQGQKVINEKAAEIRKHFTAGKAFEYNGQQVVVRSTGISQGRLVDGKYYRKSITVNFYAFLRRMLQN